MDNRKSIKVEPNVKKELKSILNKEKLNTNNTIKSESDMLSKMIDIYKGNPITVPNFVRERLLEMRSEVGLDTDTQMLFYLLELYKEKRPSLTVAQEQKCKENAINADKQLSL